jgi:hypothetical protein
MNTQWVKDKLDSRGTAVLAESHFNVVFPKPDQWERVREFCLETAASCETFPGSNPPLFIFKKRAAHQP